MAFSPSNEVAPSLSSIARDATGCSRTVQGVRRFFCPFYDRSTPKLPVRVGVCLVCDTYICHCLNHPPSMSLLRLRVGLILYGIGLLTVTLLNLVSRPSTVIPDGVGYRLTDSFERVSLNNRVLAAPDFRPIPGESTDTLRQRIGRVFKPNEYPHAVIHGHSSNVPEGWVYFPLTNPTATPKEVVLSFPPYRCGRATLFLVQVGPRLARLDSVATLRQSTPLADRFFLSYRYAFPLILPPGQTTGILLRTNGYVGYHEFDLQLSLRSFFTGRLLANTMEELLVIFSCLIIGLVSLVVGLATPSLLMRTYGYVMLVTMLMACAYYGYLSGLPYPNFLSFNSSNISSCFWFLLNAIAQLYLYQAFKSAVRGLRWYKPAMWTIIGVNLACVLLHLLPPPVYAYLNVPINRTLMVMTHIGLCWMAYFSFLAYRRKGIAYMGVFMLLFAGDMVVTKAVEFLMTHNVSLLKYPAPAQNPLLLIGLLTYLTVVQFRREHISKRQMLKEVRQARAEANALRRAEVERIGRDLHDQVGNTLAAAKGYLSRPQADADKSLQLIHTAITELRFLSHNLIKDNNRTLTEKVETLVGRFNDFSDIRFVFKDHSNNRANQLPTLQQQSIYHIVQELFTNIVRHSGASQVYVQFFGDDDSVEVSVEDDGVGFDFDSARTNGVGLQNMTKRAELAQIDLLFDPAPTGTSVLLTIHHDEALPNHPHRRSSAL
ncbi:MAG: hypothetical protein EAZ91_22080 [Cytophagales bacterium]|nr:MAG: hypothetical protein EAZ91_22080 [Cytophagales bacterium]